MSSLFIPIEQRAQGVSRRVSIKDLSAAKNAQQKWPMITCYDATTARVFDDAGFPVLLVGDSAAMVVFGFDSTIPITTDDMLPLVGAVVRGSSRALVVADLPFGTYQESIEQAVATSVRFIKEAGAHAVKLEGGAFVIPQVEALVAFGIPVMGHLGLTPQSVNQFGGYVVQGRGEAADQLVADAIALEKAGAFAIVLEVIPADLATRVTEAISIPTVGIGAGINTDAQVIVWQDLLGLTGGKKARFVKEYAQLRDIMRDSSTQWANDVVSGAYPTIENSYLK
jgi:3-methyl-2-oxobutanoate hydroxymethyltransferase